jgi:hypothetical protein
LPDALDLKGWLPVFLPLFLMAVGGSAAFVNLQSSQNNLSSRTADDTRALQAADRDAQADRAALHAQITALDKTLAGLVLEFSSSQKQVIVNTGRLNDLERGDRIATLERDMALLKYKLGLGMEGPAYEQTKPPGIRPQTFEEPIKRPPERPFENVFEDRAGRSARYRIVAVGEIEMLPRDGKPGGLSTGVRN